MIDKVSKLYLPINYNTLGSHITDKYQLWDTDGWVRSTGENIHQVTEEAIEMGGGKDI